eukprot:2804456-Prymnesium_polylepis.1
MVQEGRVQLEERGRRVPTGQLPPHHSVGGMHCIVALLGGDGHGLGVGHAHEYREEQRRVRLSAPVERLPCIGKGRKGVDVDAHD